MGKYPKAGKYKHYKGQYYEVLDTVRHSEDESLLVLYKPLYGKESLWVRPLDMFIEEMQTSDGVVKRFKYVGTDPEA